MPDAPQPGRKGRPKGAASFGWRALFQASKTPVFVLGAARRLRYANPAWEHLAGVKLADTLGLVCSARRHGTPLAAALAPTPDALAGKPDKARRPAPPLVTGPPWWDVSFTPLAGDDGTVIGFVGSITVVGEPVPASARKIPAAVAAVRERHAGHFTFDLLAGPSPATERFVSQLRHAANSDAPVWLVGEPGAGKETAARVIHHAGTRREKAFLGIDCRGLQPFLIESLLFGHGGLADSGRVGTVFLKDPAALPRDLQQRIAELFTEGKAGGPRLVCGSNRTAAEDVTNGNLRPEFHTALSVLELRVPPLRDRKEDLPRLVAHFLPGVVVELAVFEVFAALPWPGNLRELRAVLLDAAPPTGPLKRDHLPHELRVRAGLPAVSPKPPPKLDAVLEAVEKRLIRAALAKAGGNATKAADALGVFRTRLLRRIEALGLDRPGGAE